MPRRFAPRNDRGVTIPSEYSWVGNTDHIAHALGVGTAHRIATAASQPRNDIKRTMEAAVFPANSMKKTAGLRRSF